MKEFLLKRKIRRYARNLEKYGDDPVYLQKLANLYVHISQREEAIKYYHQAIEAYYQDDSRLGQNNEFILGVGWAILKLEPMDSVAHRTLGQEYCGLGDFAKAAELYESFAVKLAKAGQYQEAMLQYRNALILFPEALQWRQDYFGLLWKLHRKEEAVQELRKIAALAERTGKIAKAVECYQKALKIMPSSPEFQIELRRLMHSNKHGEHQLRLVVNNEG